MVYMLADKICETKHVEFHSGLTGWFLDDMFLASCPSCRQEASNALDSMFKSLAGENSEDS